MLFNDEEGASVEDSLTDSDSKFNEFLEQLLKDWVDDPELPYSKVEVKKIELFKARARLYGDKDVEWAKMDIRFYKDDLEELLETYWFTVETFNINFRKMRDHYFDL